MPNRNHRQDVGRSQCKLTYYYYSYSCPVKLTYPTSAPPMEYDQQLDYKFDARNPI